MPLGRLAAPAIRMPASQRLTDLAGFVFPVFEYWEEAPSGGGGGGGGGGGLGTPPPSASWSVLLLGRQNARSSSMWSRNLRRNDPRKLSIFAPSKSSNFAIGRLLMSSKVDRATCSPEWARPRYTTECPALTPREAAGFDFRRGPVSHQRALTHVCESPMFMGFPGGAQPVGWPVVIRDRLRACR